MGEYTTKAIVVSVLFVCITIVAMYFQRAGLLWWYILPCLIAID